MSRSKEELLAYAAGLFEGEGSVFHSGSATATISMTDLEPIQKFLECVQIGKINGPYRTTGNKPVYRWLVYSYDNVQQLFDMIGSWLGPRRTKQFQDTLSHRPPPREYSPDCGLSDPNIPSQAGWARHHRGGEPPCEACVAAKSLYLKLYKGGKLETTRPYRSLTTEQAREVKDLLAQGMSQRKIAKRFGVNRTVVKNISEGKTYKEI